MSEWSRCRPVYRSPPGFAWSNNQSVEPAAGCQLPPRVDNGGTHRSTLGPASPGVSRWGSGIPCYGGTHQERHLRPVRLERCSGVTRIVVPAELSRLGVPTLLIYRPRRVGVAARAAKWFGRGTHVSSDGRSTPPNAAVGARWRSMHVRFVTNWYLLY